MVAETIEQSNRDRIDAENESINQQKEEKLLENFHKNSDIEDISQFLDGKIDQEFEDLYKKSIKEKIIGLLEVEYLNNPDNFNIKKSLITVLYGDNNEGGNENAFMQRKGVALDNKDDLYNELIIVISKTNKESIEDLYESQSKKDSHEYLRNTAYDNLYDNLVTGDTNIPSDLSREEKQDYIEKNTNKDENIKQGEELIYNNDFIKKFFNEDGNSNKEDIDFFNHPEVENDISLILSNFVISSTITSLNQASDNDLKQINIALNSSFDIQIANVLQNKVNYPEKTVDKMIREIHDGNPFEKIKIYEELKQLVNNKEGISGKAMEKGKKDITTRVQKILLLRLERQKEELVIKLSDSNLNKKEALNIKEEIEQLENLMIINTVAEGEVFTGNLKIEGEKTGDDRISENK